MFSDTVTVSLVDASGSKIPLSTLDGTDATNGYSGSVKESAYDLSQNGSSDLMKQAAKALYDYGITAQINFRYGNYTGLTVDPAVTAVQASQICATTVGGGGTKPSGVGAINYTVDYDVENGYIIYYTLANNNPNAYTFTVDDAPVTAEPTGDGRYAVNYMNVQAQDLGTDVRIAVTDGTNTFTILMSGLRFARFRVERANTEEAKNLNRALYLYSKAISAFVGSQG